MFSQPYFIYRWAHADKAKSSSVTPPRELDATNVWRLPPNEQSGQSVPEASLGSTEQEKPHSPSANVPNNIDAKVKDAKFGPDISRKETTQMTRFKSNLNQCNSIRALCVQIKAILKEIDPNVDKKPITREDNPYIVGNDVVDFTSVASVRAARKIESVGKIISATIATPCANSPTHHIIFAVNLDSKDWRVHHKSTQTNEEVVEEKKEKVITVPNFSKVNENLSNGSKPTELLVKVMAPPPPPPPPPPLLPMMSSSTTETTSLTMPPPPPPPMSNMSVTSATKKESRHSTSNKAVNSSTFVPPAAPPPPTLPSSSTGPLIVPAPLPMPAAGNAWLKNDSE